MSLAGPPPRSRSRQAGWRVAIQSVTLSHSVSSPPPPPPFLLCTLLACLLVGLLAPPLARWLECLKWPRAETLISTATAAAGTGGGRQGGGQEQGDRATDPSLAGPIRLTECDVTARHSLRLGARPPAPSSPRRTAYLQCLPVSGDPHPFRLG